MFHRSKQITILFLTILDPLIHHSHFVLLEIQSENYVLVDKIYYSCIPLAKSGTGWLHNSHFVSSTNLQLQS